jgi:hypothetical protein
MVAPPAVALVGEIEEIVGIGVVFVTEKVSVLDVPPPGAGLTTVTFAVAGAATSMIGICAVNTVLLL